MGPGEESDALPVEYGPAGGGGTEEKLSEVNKNSSLETWKCVGAGKGGRGALCGRGPPENRPRLENGLHLIGFVFRLMRSSPKLMSCVD